MRTALPGKTRWSTSRDVTAKHFAGWETLGFVMVFKILKNISVVNQGPAVQQLQPGEAAQSTDPHPQPCHEPGTESDAGESLTSTHEVGSWRNPWHLGPVQRAWRSCSRGLQGGTARGEAAWAEGWHGELRGGTGNWVAAPGTSGFHQDLSGSIRTWGAAPGLSPPPDRGTSCTRAVSSWQ